jgi:hypothetical protein
MLPKVNYALSELEIPSTKKIVKVRPMLGKEEKILLQAKESTNDEDVMLAIKQVVNNCIIDDGFDIDKLSIFDLEFLFIKLRALSVNNIIKLSYVDNEDQQTYDFEVDLNTIKVKWPEKINKTIVINDQINVRMKYPDAKLYSNKEFLNAQGREVLDRLLQNCVDKVYEGTTSYDFATASPEEIQTFMESLPIIGIEKMREFLLNLPTVYHEISYKNKQDHERKVIMQTLNDFFTLR